MLRLVLLALLLISPAAFAHDGLDLPPPINNSEAWNAMQLCAANVDRLIAASQ